MTQEDVLHATARELAESIADRLNRLDPESAVLSDVNRLVQLLIQLQKGARAS